MGGDDIAASKYGLTSDHVLFTLNSFSVVTALWSLEVKDPMACHCLMSGYVKLSLGSLLVGTNSLL
jgi:hypothetical protein